MTQPPPPVVAPAPTLIASTLPCDEAKTLPQSLEVLGNARAWTEVRDHITRDATSSVPLMIDGPTGCGKTTGVKELLTHLGMRPVFLDAVEADDTHQMCTWIKRARDSNSFDGTRAVIVVDDMEGFTANMRSELVKFAMDRRTALNPMLLICNNIRELMWRPFSQVPSVRLFAPRDYSCLRYFTQEYPKRWVQHIVQANDNDLRQIKMSLDACSERKASLDQRGEHFDLTKELPLLGGNADRSSNVFHSLSDLVKNGVTPDEWIRDTGELTERVVFSNYPHMARDVDAMAAMADVLSASDTHLTHFTERGHLVPFGDDMRARSVLTHANSIPKLTLSAYPRASRSATFTDVPSALLE